MKLSSIWLDISDEKIKRNEIYSCICVDCNIASSYFVYNIPTAMGVIFTSEYIVIAVPMNVV